MKRSGGTSLKSVKVDWQTVTYMEDNPDNQMVVVSAGGRDWRLGVLQKGTRVGCPIPAIDGVRFMTDDQLVEAATVTTRKRKRKTEDAE